MPPPVARRGQRAGWIVAAVALAAMAAFVAPYGVATCGASTRRALNRSPPTGTTFARGEAAASIAGRTRHRVCRDRRRGTHVAVRALAILDSRAPAGGHRRRDVAVLGARQPAHRLLCAQRVEDGGRVGRDAADPCGRSRARGGTWSKDDVIVFVPYPNVQAQQIPSAGGTATAVKTPNPAPHLRWFPSFLPDGRHYLYLAVDLTTRRGTAVHVASLDSAETRELVPSTVSATYADPGVLLFRRDAVLAGQRFDDRHAAAGRSTPAVLADNVDYSPAGYQMFASASTGVLVYQEPDPGWHLTWFDRTGRRLGAAVPAAGQYNGLCLSRDGARLVYVPGRCRFARRPISISRRSTWRVARPRG